MKHSLPELREHASPFCLAAYSHSTPARLAFRPSDIVGEKNHCRDALFVEEERVRRASGGRDAEEERGGGRDEVTRLAVFLPSSLFTLFIGTSPSLFPFRAIRRPSG